MKVFHEVLADLKIKPLNMRGGRRESVIKETRHHFDIIISIDIWWGDS